VSIIIPTRNNLEYLRRCLTSLLEKTRYPRYEIVLMDDHSSDPDVLDYYQALLSAHDCVSLHHNQQAFNYSRVNNHGARQARGSLLLFLNNDVEILTEDWLEDLVRWVLLPGVGMAGAKLLYPDGLIQHAGIVVGMTGHANHVFAGDCPSPNQLVYSADWYRNVSAVTGACMLVRRAVFEQVGGFDEDLSLVFNDVELCQRVLRAGQRIVYTPAACLIHYEGRSRARYIPPANIRLGAELLADAVARGDPYYSPNLSLAVHWPTFRRANDPQPLWQMKAIVRYKG
jgi:GT2 family glycosyltransferase